MDKFVFFPAGSASDDGYDLRSIRIHLDPDEVGKKIWAIEICPRIFSFEFEDFVDKLREDLFREQEATYFSMELKNNSFYFRVTGVTPEPEIDEIIMVATLVAGKAIQFSGLTDYASQKLLEHLEDITVGNIGDTARHNAQNRAGARGKSSPSANKS